MTNLKNIYDIPVEFDSENSGKTFIDVGIHENIELKSVTYKVSDKGNQFLAFLFANPEGIELSFTEYEPKDEDLVKFQSKTQNQIKRVHHLMTKFITKEEAELKANSFKEFAEAVIAKLSNKFVGVKLRIKVIYGWNDYTTLPKYTPFIELMSIPKEQSKLKISSIDKMTKDSKDKESSTTVDPFGSTEDLQGNDTAILPVSDNTDKLPF